MTGPVQAPLTAGPYTTTSLGILAALSLTAAGIRALLKTLQRRRCDPPPTTPDDPHPSSQAAR